MKKLETWMLPVILLVFALGIGILVYPSVSNWWNTRHQGYVVQSYSETVKNTDAEQIAAQKEAVAAYNRSLLRNHVILTDPFDPMVFPITDGEYDELLNLAGDGIMGTIEIPLLSLELPVYHGTSEEILQEGIGHLENTSPQLGARRAHRPFRPHGAPHSGAFHKPYKAAGRR